MKAQATSTRSLLKLYYHTYLIEKIAFILIVQQYVPKVSFVSYIGMSFFFILVNVRFGGSRMLDQPNKSQDPTNTK